MVLSRRKARGIAGGDTQYAAFISYSRAVDLKLAPALQNAIQRLAKPWYRARAVRVFRDDASLSANPGLWGSIVDAMDRSEFFILLASHESAHSTWVTKEVQHWLSIRSAENLLIALTDGELAWNDAEARFDPSGTTALSAELCTAFMEEPRYVDLRWVRKEEHLSSSDGRFLEAVADLAAPLHHRSKDELVGEHVRQNRRTRRLVRAVIAVLAALVLLASAAAVVAYQQRETAVEQRDVAESRQLAAQADLMGDRDLQQAMLLSVAAADVSGTDQARASLVHQLQRNPNVERFVTGPGKAIDSVAVGVDGKQIASTTSGSNSVTLWSMSSGQRLARLAGDGDVTSPAFSPDGRTLAAGEGTPFKNAHVAIWDLSTRAVVATLGGGVALPRPVYSPDGQTVAVPRTDPNGVVLWNVATQEKQNVPTEDMPTLIAFSPDGRLLAIDQAAGILLWDMTQAAPAGLLSGVHTRGIFDLAFSPDGTLVVSGGHDAQVVLWDVASRGALAAWTMDGDVTSVSFSSDGSLFAAGDISGAVTVWETGTRQRRAVLTGAHTSEISAIAFSPTEPRIVSAGVDGRIVVWNMQPRDRLIRGVLPGVPGEATTGAVTVAPTADLLAASTGSDVLIWRTSDESLVRTLHGAGDHPAFSPDGKIIITVDSDSVLVWDVASGRQVAVLARGAEPYDPTVGPVFSPDGQFLATAADDSVTLWNIDSFTPEKLLFRDAGDSIAGLAFSADGRLLASGGLGFEDIVVWNVQSGTRASEMSSRSGEPVGSLAFSPDGDLLAWSARESANTALGGQVNIHIWNFAAQSDRAVAPGFGRVAFSPDGRLLVWDGSGVSLWSLAENGLVGRLTPDDLEVMNPAFSADGRTLVTTTRNGQVLLWDMDEESWAQRLCKTVGRDLLASEWEAAVPERPFRSACP